MMVNRLLVKIGDGAEVLKADADAKGDEKAKTKAAKAAAKTKSKAGVKKGKIAKLKGKKAAPQTEDIAPADIPPLELAPRMRATLTISPIGST